MFKSRPHLLLGSIRIPANNVPFYAPGLSEPLSKCEGLHAFYQGYIFLGQRAGLVDGRLPDVAALGHVFPAQVSEEGGAARLHGPDGIFRGVVLAVDAPTPVGHELHFALAQHVLQVEGGIGGAVVGEVRGEIVEGAKDRQFGSELPQKQACGEVERLLIDELMGLGHGIEADEVVSHDLPGDTLAVVESDDVERHHAVVETGVFVAERLLPFCRREEVEHRFLCGEELLETFQFVPLSL